MIALNGLDEKTLSIVKSNTLYRYYYNMLKNLVMSLFEWDNVPKSMDANFLEKVLYEVGYCAVINHKTLGIINTRCSSNSNQNLYELSLSYNCYSVSDDYGGYDYDSDNFVLVKNNKLMHGVRYIVQLFALKLHNIDMEISNNINLQKFSAIMMCDEKERLTILNIIKQWENNQPLILSKKSLDLNNKVDKLDFNIPYVADKLYLAKEKIMNEFLTYIGVNNLSVEKKERLVTGEVDVNNELIESNANVMLETRQQAVEEINDKFGLDITVKLSTNRVEKSEVVMNE